MNLGIVWETNASVKYQLIGRRELRERIIVLVAKEESG